ncbi:MAG: hypothetical protein ACRCZM_07070 [Bacteroidales bacterium]
MNLIIRNRFPLICNSNILTEDEMKSSIGGACGLGCKGGCPESCKQSSKNSKKKK